MATNTQTIILKPGETFTLPPGAELKYVSDPNSLASDCVNPPESSYKCGYFLAVIDDDGNDGHPFDEDSMGINKLYVGGIVYDMALLAKTLLPTLGYPNGRPDLLNALVDTSIIEFTSVGQQDYTKRTYLKMYFKVLDIYFDDMEMELDERADGASAPSPMLAYLKANEWPCNDFTFGF